MTKSLTIICFLALAVNLAAQEVQVMEHTWIKPADRVILGELPQGNDPYFRNTEKTPEPGLAHKNEAWKALERRMMVDKREAMKNGEYFQPIATSRSSAQKPFVIQSFVSELSQSHPNDNEGAVSPTGALISTTNTGVKIYDDSQNLLFETGLVGFSNSINTRTNLKYDPRTLYDAQNDRFIIVFLSGATPAQSQIVVCFSETNDPLGAWNVYALEGNLQPEGIDVWADYPTIGISKSDLYISVNLFEEDFDYQRVGIFQMSLENGYKGDPLNTQSYTVGGDLITITPIHDESAQLHDEFYFVTFGDINSRSGRELTFLRVTDALANGGTLQSGTVFNSSNAYFPAPPMPQRDSDNMLSPGFGRVNNAFRRDESLYFSFSTGLFRRSSIFVGRLKLSPLGFEQSRLTSDVLMSIEIEYAFPSMCWAGDTDGEDHSLFIFFNYSGVNFLPGTGVIHMNTAGDFSEPLLLSESEIPAPDGRNPGEPRRWGDYTDISYMGDGKAWGFGYHYPANEREATFASQIAISPVSSVDENTASLPEPVIISPNPVFERASFTFEVPQTGYYKAEILDLNGKVVSLVVEDRLIRGKAKLAFDTHHLSQGMYFVRVTGESKELMQGKFVVE